ncbi:MAG: hypothetical protein LBQ58_02130 [Synergistaceae bacterium]|jgi:hypothetical protein|nr:hypothetical protein [Synergistaceae bacterium]
MYSCRFYAITLCLLLVLGGVGSASQEHTLPAVPGWQCGELKEVEFDAVSGNQGFWQERDYRTPGGVSFKAVIMGGKGPKYYNQPPDGVISDDGPLGSGGTYRTVTVGGYRAVLETHPLLGISLAVNAFKSGYVLTIEGSAWLSESDLIDAAQTLIPLLESSD